MMEARPGKARNEAGQGIPRVRVRQGEAEAMLVKTRQGEGRVKA